MAYVDLNPSRAAMATKPESSEHTSIKKRIDLLALGKPAPSSIEAFVGIQDQTIGILFSV